MKTLFSIVLTLCYTFIIAQVSDTLIMNDGKVMPCDVIGITETEYQISINSRKTSISKEMVSDWIPNPKSLTQAIAKVQVDQFDESKKITTEPWKSIGKDKAKRWINGYCVGLGNNVNVFFISYYGDLGCLVKTESTMKVKLKNGDIIDFIQITDTECGENKFVGFVPLTKEEIEMPDYSDLLIERNEQLKEFEWVLIRITGSQYYTDITPNYTRTLMTPDRFFMQHLDAIYKAEGN